MARRPRDLRATSFLTLEGGTPVVDRFGQPVGSVEEVVLNRPEAFFDGVIVRTPAGRRFIDAPEVRRISRGAVTLGIAADEVLDPASRAVGPKGAPVARGGRTVVTEADRDAAIGALKRAYVREDLTLEELADGVAIAHEAETFEELDGALRDIDLD
jgi:hypothetical protein